MADRDFRLQPVLNYKSSVVEALEMEFARLKLKHLEEQQVLDGLQQRQQQHMDSLRQQQQQGRLDCDLIQLHQQYLRSLTDHVAAQTARVNEVAQQAETKREELVKTMQDRKVLERLRERFRARQAQELLRRETRAVDEIVTTRYVRERSS